MIIIKKHQQEISLAKKYVIVYSISSEVVHEPYSYHTFQICIPFNIISQ